MEPAQRTAEHRALIAQRRHSLGEVSVRILADSDKFVWEIGCGHGHFLTAYAAAHRADLCIGIDLSRDRIDRAERKRKSAELANVHFVQADAHDFLAALPPAARFSAIYILFPDPWPKRRHHKNRLLTPAFLDLVAGRAEEGTPLFFRTDYEPYFTEARDAIARSATWRLGAEPWPFDTPTVFQARAPVFHSLVAARTEAPL